MKTLIAATEQLQEKYFITFDNLDKERVRYIPAAKNHAGSPPPNGVYKWYTLLKCIGKKVTYWKLRLHLYISKTYTSDMLLRLRRTLVIDNKGTHELKYVDDILKQARKELRLVRSNTRENRASHMDKLAESFVVSRNTTRTIELKKITTSERTRNTVAKNK